MEDRPTLDELDEQLSAVNDWRGLGSRLNVSDNSLSEIRLKYSKVRECRKEALSLWLQHNFMNASRNAMVDALHGIGEHAVADQYSEYVQTLPPTTRQLDIGPRPRREGGFKYSKAETETQVHTGRSAIVSISNNPIVNVNTNIVHSDAKRKSTKQRRNVSYICIVVSLLLIAIACCLFLLFNRSMNDMETKTDEHESNSGKTLISIDNPETVIATRLIEITDLYLLASCLEIKHSKAKVEQLIKNHRGKQEHIRIDVIDIWLKAAEQRYWEDLLEPLQQCLDNKRLAKSLEDEFI